MTPEGHPIEAQADTVSLIKRDDEKYGSEAQSRRLRQRRQNKVDSLPR